MTQWKTKLATRIWLYETLVKIVLLYNCGTWGVSKDDQRKLNSFQRRQLRKVIRVHWSHKISNNKLYKITHRVTKPLSITTTERRLKLLGCILRLPADCSARKAMRYYFEKRTNKIFRRRTTIVSILNEDIKWTKVSQVSLLNLYTKAKNRKLWSKIVQQVVKSAYSRWLR